MAGCEESCQSEKSRRDDNCYDADPADGLPVQCVGEWAEEKKHLILRNFIQATEKARAKFIPPRGRGGAAFIDLFAGPGRARVRSTGAVVDGSPLIAVKHSAAPFTNVILCDLNEANVEALRRRTQGDPRVEVVPGDCNENIARIVAMVPQYGLNLALVDPYGVAAMDFESIKGLALACKRMDLLIHFPTGDMKRNIANAKASEATKERMKRALGGGVRAVLPRDVAREIETLRTNLAALGYTGKNVRSVPVANGQGVVMYHLVYASRDPLGDKIWDSVTAPKDQRELRLV